MRYLKLVGGMVIGTWANIVWAIRLLWALGFLAFAALLVVDLIRIPVSVNRSEEYAPEKKFWEKMSPEAEERLKEFQGYCRHVYRHNGFVTYYCPMCRKKLVKGTVPLWQI